MIDPATGRYGIAEIGTLNGRIAACAASLPQDAAQAIMDVTGRGDELAVTWRGCARAAIDAFQAAHPALYGFTFESLVELVTLPS